MAVYVKLSIRLRTRRGKKCKFRISLKRLVCAVHFCVILIIINTYNRIQMLICLFVSSRNLLFRCVRVLEVVWDRQLYSPVFFRILKSEHNAVNVAEGRVNASTACLVFPSHPVQYTLLYADISFALFPFPIHPIRPYLSRCCFTTATCPFHRTLCVYV